MFEIDRRIVANALSMYKYKLEYEIQWYNDIAGDSDSGLVDVMDAKDKENATKKELAKLNELLSKFNSDGGCMADYKFFAEKR